MKKSTLLPFLVISTSLLFVSACEDEGSIADHMKFTFTPAHTDAEVQTAMIEMNDGDTIYFTQGNYQFTTMLSIDGKSNFVVLGDGRNNTFLSFEGQTSGAQGIYGTSLKWALFRDFTITDPEGDGIKVKDSDGITFLRIGVMHTNAADSTNGGYGIYPVACDNILIDDCYVYGASDAGIYVGQSSQVIVRNSEVEGNVAGIEIENCINADVHDNESHDNAGGIVVFDLPNLPVIRNGHSIRVFNNTIASNDLVNFALAGNIVASVPTGTGIMLMAAKSVEVFDNTITENNVMSVGIISFNTLSALNGIVITDTVYVSFSKEIHVHDNTITSSINYPSVLNPISDLLVNAIFGGGDVPDILYDGFVHPDFAADSTKGICIQGNGSATFANLDVAGSFLGLSFNATPHNCSRTSLTAVTVMAPTP